MKKNPVAKFSRRYNKAVVMKDRKREFKKTGSTKNSEITQEYEEDSNVGRSQISS